MNIDKAIDYYSEGYNVGIHWKEDYTPGGPWVCRCGTSHEQESINNNKEWLLGFSDGVNEVRERCKDLL